MPVSATAKRIRPGWPSVAPASCSTVSETDPFSVNLIALAKRLEVIWRSRNSSDKIASGTLRANRTGERDLLGLRQGHEQLLQILNERLQDNRTRFKFHAIRLAARPFQKFIHQLKKTVRRLLQHVQILYHGRRQTRLLLLDDEFKKLRNSTNRRSNFVTEHGQESTLRGERLLGPFHGRQQFPFNQNAPINFQSPACVPGTGEETAKKRRPPAISASTVSKP